MPELHQQRRKRNSRTEATGRRAISGLREPGATKDWDPLDQGEKERTFSYQGKEGEGSEGCGLKDACGVNSQLQINPKPRVVRALGGLLLWH